MQKARVVLQTLVSPNRFYLCCNLRRTSGFPAFGGFGDALAQEFTRSQIAGKRDVFTLRRLSHCADPTAKSVDVVDVAAVFACWRLALPDPDHAHLHGPDQNIGEGIEFVARR